jgi:hypothetical protein
MTILIRVTIKLKSYFFRYRNLINVIPTKITPAIIHDSFLSKPVTIRFDPIDQTATIQDKDGYALPAVRAFWFAWYSFYPDTEVYTSR